MLTYNIGFITNDQKMDGTQLCVEEQQMFSDVMVELFNLILRLKDEMNIKEIVYIEYVEEEEED